MRDLELLRDKVSSPGSIQSKQASNIRDKYDLDLSKCSEVVNHGMFNTFQIETDSNEREMIGGKRLIMSAEGILRNSNVTLHFDNTNAAIIYGKGSPKFRLQKYAIDIDNLSLQWNFQLNTVAIPRCLNQFSDELSNCVDMDDYGVNQDFFMYCCEKFEFHCNFDRFANNLNTKTPKFNSVNNCLGTSGVDAFNYNWGFGVKNWLFPPPNLIMFTLNHLMMCKGMGLLLTPPMEIQCFLSPNFKNVWQIWEKV